MVISAINKNKECWREVAILHRVVREDPFNEVTFEQGPENNKTGNHEDMWGNGICQGGCSDCKGFGTVGCLARA